jgi:hypothetical protein
MASILRKSRDVTTPISFDYVGSKHALNGEASGVHRQGVAAFSFSVQTVGLAHPLHARPKVMVSGEVHASTPSGRTASRLCHFSVVSLSTSSTHPLGYGQAATIL